jgi:serine/threonine-protein kinase
VDGGPLNIRSGPILATMFPWIDGKEDKAFLVAGEAFVTPDGVYIQIDGSQLTDGSWLPLCGVAYAGEDKDSNYQFGVPTYAVEPLAVPPLDPALVDSRPGSVRAALTRARRPGDIWSAAGVQALSRPEVR